MSNRLWEHRTSGEINSHTLYHYSMEGMQQAMICDESGNLYYHVIEKSNHPEWLSEIIEETGVSRSTGMLLKSPIFIVPKSFQKANIPGVLAHSSLEVPLDSENFVHFTSDFSANCFHGIIPAYHFAKEQSRKKKNYVLCCYFQHTAYILFFREGKCEICNVFPVGNESEALYFAIAPVQKLGLTLDSVNVELLANAAELQSLTKTFKRFLPNVSPASIELPYPSGEYPPHAAEAFLLFTYPKCVLQAAT